METTKESFRVRNPGHDGDRRLSKRNRTRRGAERTALDPSTSDDVRRAADEVASSVEELYRVANAFLGQQVEERPYAVLGVAAGVGFVLGGGLASRLGGTLANYGVRILMSRFMSDWFTPSAPVPPSG